jgi:hypothetical protein
MDGLTLPDPIMAAAGEANLLVQIGAGVGVADVFTDPVSDVPTWLIAHISPGLLDDPDFSRLAHAARASRGVAAMDVTVCVPPNAHPAQSLHFMHFLRLPAGDAFLRLPAEHAAAQPVVSVRESTADDDELIADWLTTAINDGYLACGAALAPGRAAAAAAQVMDRADRQTFVAESAGCAVGHVTLLTSSAADIDIDAHRRPLMELFDVLVADPQVRRTAEKALVTAASRFAATRGADLLGSVICENTSTARPCERIVAALVAAGWQLDYDYVKVPIHAP